MKAVGRIVEEFKEVENGYFAYYSRVIPLYMHTLLHLVPTSYLYTYWLTFVLTGLLLYCFLPRWRSVGRRL